MPLDTSYAVQRLMTDVPRTLKPKHVQLLVNASYDTPMSQLFNQLHPALNSGNWVIVFKALSLIHLLSRQGNSDRVLGYLAGNKEILSMEYFRDRSGHPMGSFQSKNIAAYANYLSVKTDIYRKTKSDFVANREEHQVMLKTSESAPELILKCEQLQTLIEAACKCNWEREDLDHIVVRQAYRLMLADMMALFQLMNEGVVAVLGLYFLMPRPDALKALSVYKTFAVQAKKAVDVFNQGRKMKHELGMDIPSFSHPPLELANSLEAYVNAPDFEQQREAYAKKKGKKTNGFFDNPSKKTERVEKVEKDKPLIDFFDSLDTQVDQFRNEPAPAFNAFWDPNSEAYSPHSNGNPFNTADIIQQQQQLELQMQETNRMLQQQ
ncbi:ANTH domain-containing protein, partial [Gorgonomyces haynaldii]